MKTLIVIRGILIAVLIALILLMIIDILFRGVLV